MTSKMGYPIVIPKIPPHASILQKNTTNSTSVSSSFNVNNKTKVLRNCFNQNNKSIMCISVIQSHSAPEISIQHEVLSAVRFMKSSSSIADYSFYESNPQNNNDDYNKQQNSDTKFSQLYRILSDRKNLESLTDTLIFDIEDTVTNYLFLGMVNVDQKYAYSDLAINTLYRKNWEDVETVLSILLVLLSFEKSKLKAERSCFVNEGFVRKCVNFLCATPDIVEQSAIEVLILQMYTLFPDTKIYIARTILKIINDHNNNSSIQQYYGIPVALRMLVRMYKDPKEGNELMKCNDIYFSTIQLFTSAHLEKFYEFLHPVLYCLYLTYSQETSSLLNNTIHYLFGHWPVYNAKKAMFFNDHILSLVADFHPILSMRTAEKLKRTIHESILSNNSYISCSIIQKISDSHVIDALMVINKGILSMICHDVQTMISTSWSAIVRGAAQAALPLLDATTKKYSNLCIIENADNDDGGDLTDSASDTREKAKTNWNLLRKMAK